MNIRPMLLYIRASVCLAAVFLLVWPASGTESARHDAPGITLARRDILGAPIVFEANEGQENADVRFVCRPPGSKVFFTDSEVVLVLPGGPKPTARPSVLRLRFPGANKELSIGGVEPLAGRLHYLTGRNPDSWTQNVSAFRRVRYRNLYPGIDLTFYGREEKLEFDFIVSPDSDVDAIHMSFDGAESLELDSDGSLVARTNAGIVRYAAPRVYQTDETRKIDIEGFYVRRGEETFGLQVGEHRQPVPLIIDPVLDYSTFTGPASATAIAVDNAGQAIIAGKSFSPDYPVADALQPICTPPSYPYPPCEDIFVTKLSADGSSLIFSTFLGGEGADGAESLTVDGDGAIYITGQTWSADFPVVSAVQDQCALSTYSGSCSGDAFVTKMAADGASLIYSTFLGGRQTDHGYDIAVDVAGQAHVTGDVSSPDFPVSNAFQPSCALAPGPYSACQDIFVTKLNETGTSFVYSSFLGSPLSDSGRGVATDLAGNTYVAGSASAGFPTVNAINAEGPGAVVTKIAADGSALLYSTYLGGGRGNDIAVDLAGRAHVTGRTNDPAFPVQDAIQAACSPSSYGCSEEAFVTKLSADGGSLDYSTYLGGYGTDEGHGIALDSRGRAFVVGTTTSPDFPVIDPIQAESPNSSEYFTDAFAAAIESDGAVLLYSTYLGGSQDDEALAIATASGGTVFLTGTSDSDDFPLVNPFETDCCGVIAAKIALPQPLEVGLSPAILWPPNHRMVRIQATVVTPDECATESLSLVDIISDEADNATGEGDGNTTDDIQDDEPGTSDLSFRLRAERAGAGHGRTYTATYAATACDGSSSTGSASVFVPHDMIGGEEPLLLTADENESGLYLRWSPVWDAFSYRVARGQLDNLWESPDGYFLGALACITHGLTVPTTLGTEDPLMPPLGQAFFYLVDYDNGDSVSFGTAGAQKDRIVLPGHLQCP